MRFGQPFTRALISVLFCLVLALVLLVPRDPAPAEARPLPQQAVDLAVDDASKSGDRGTTVIYTLTLTNNTPITREFTIDVSSGGGFIPDFSSPVTVAANSSQQFVVGINIPADADPGTVETATVIVDSQLDPPVSARRTLQTTVTVNGQVPTATTTSTPEGTPQTTATPGPLCQDRYEPDNRQSDSKEIRPDEPQGGEAEDNLPNTRRAICPLGDEDWLFFGGVAGKVYTIDILAMSPGLDLSLSLYDVNGNLLAFNDDFPRSTDPTDPQNIRPRIQSYRVPTNSQYYIKVRDDAGRGAPNLEYTIEVQSETYGPTPTLIPEVCTDLFEPDGTPEQARLITIRENQPNHKLCPAGDADWVRFFAKSGQPFTLSTNSNQVAGADTTMILVDRDGATILDFNDDSNGTLDSRIDYVPAVDGFYYAQVKNVGDIGNQFIAYDLSYNPGGDVVTEPTEPPEGPTEEPTITPEDGTPLETPTIDPDVTPTITRTPDPDATPVEDCPPRGPYPPGCEPTETPDPDTTSLGGVKGQPPFVNGPANDFIDPALRNVWSRTDQVVATRRVDRSWIWGPAGLVARAEVYGQSPGGVRQVQYFDKARMEISDWGRDRTNPWFVTNGLLVKELVEGRLQIGDDAFVDRPAAAIPVAGDAGDTSGPTYASFAGHTGRADDRTGQIAAASLRRDGSVGAAVEHEEAKLAHYVSETGHNIPQVFWSFLNARGPVGDGSREDVLVDWVFAMGYPISEPYWTRATVGGVERDVLVQAFQRRVLTYTPDNPAGWKVEMGNVGRHYYLWRYARQP